MIRSVALCLLTALTAQVATVPTGFTEVAPSGPPYVRSVGKDRAVVVIQGFTLHLTKNGNATIKWHSYQHAGSPLVKMLSQEADVFAFAYGLTHPVSTYADLPVLRENIQSVRNLGYREIVLIGFSAGGLIARQFVEDFPGYGVTKVIQVDSPNLGTELAIGSRNLFGRSLTHKARQEFMQGRREKRIPPGVQFACVVGTGLMEGDGVVSLRSQWPEDLQEQAIPARVLATTHRRAARSQAGVHLIADLVREPIPRWSAAEVAAMRHRMRDMKLPW